MSLHRPQLSCRFASLLPFAALLLMPSARASTRFVDVQLATGNNDGSSWADAYRGVDGLQLALAAAASGDQIWVAQGTYKPTLTTNRNIYFDLKTGVAIYGGFDGTETLLAERDPVANETILSGDLAGNDPTVTDNSIHVVRGNSANATAVLDGFTVRGGNANGAAAGSNDRGGGFLMTGGSNATIARCVVKENRCTFGGGAGYITQSSPTFTDTRFENNVGGAFGGAFDMATSVGATFNRCVFSGNSAARAGGIEIFGSSPVKAYNCLFVNNTATGAGGGGAMFISSSAAVIRNCTVVDNHATTNVAGILHTGGGTTLANSIVAFNTGPGGSQAASEQLTATAALTASYSCVVGGFTGTGITGADPLFVDAGNGDFHLAVGSPCVDAGNSLLSINVSSLDLELAPRFADDPTTLDSGAGSPPIVDMGVFEIQNELYEQFCFGDGSLTTGCPCANFGAMGHGCGNSDPFGLGGVLLASGSPNPDLVVLTASEMMPNAACIFLQGNANLAAGVVFGDGVRCVGGQLIRLGIKQAVNGIATYPENGDPSITDRAAVYGDFIGSGDTRYYQTYYRDPDPTFCAAPAGNTWNVTGGVVLHW